MFKSKIAVISTIPISKNPETGGQLMAWSFIKALSKIFTNVDVFHYGYINKSEKCDNIHIKSIEAYPKPTYSERPWLVPYFVFDKISLLRNLKFFMYDNIYKDKLFKDIIHKIEADILFQEAVGTLLDFKYIYNLTKRRDNLLLIRLHDIFSLYFLDESDENFLQNIIYKKILNYEITSYSKMDHIFTLSKRDENFLKRYKIKNISTLIPAIDDELLKEEEKIYLPVNQPIVFLPFAHRDLLSLTSCINFLAKKLPDVHFVLTTVKREELQRYFNKPIPNNIILVGKLNRKQVNYLYRISQLVLIPRKARTGTSVRVIEAIYHRKPLITTSQTAMCFTGFNLRGLIIEDDFLKYPEIVSKILNDERFYQENKEELNEDAKKLSFENLCKQLKTFFEKYS